MSNEPGLTLGRLIAAEKNSAAAVQLSKKNSESQSKMMAKIVNLEQKINQLESQIASLKKLVVRQIGGGPTG